MGGGGGGRLVARTGSRLCPWRCALTPNAAADGIASRYVFLRGFTAARPRDKSAAARHSPVYKPTIEQPCTIFYGNVFVIIYCIGLVREGLRTAIEATRCAVNGNCDGYGADRKWKSHMRAHARFRVRTDEFGFNEYNVYVVIWFCFPIYNSRT